MKLLIVDDELGIRTILKRMVYPYGVEVVEAENGAAALDAIEEGGISAALIDVYMPVLTGLEVLRAIRSSPAHAKLPVTLIGGAIDAEITGEAIRLGVVDVLAKPFDTQYTKTRLIKMLESIKNGTEPTQRGASKDEAWARGPRTVLIVDRDREYRYFAASVLTPRFEVIQVESGQEALKVCTSCHPAAIIIGTDVGILGPTHLCTKLRERLALQDVRLILAGTDQGDTSAFDGVLSRAFVPEEFAERFEQLVARQFSFSDRATPCGLIYATLGPATEQAIGMVAHTSIRPAGKAQPAAAGEIAASVTLRMPDQNLEVDLFLRCSLATATLLAARMLQAEPADIATEDSHSVVGELVNVIAGRLQSAAAAQWGQTKFTLPRIAVCNPARDASPHVQIRFDSDASDACIHVGLAARHSEAANAA